MSKLMLVDAVHPEETRVALVADGRVDDFDFEAAGKRQLRGNIYLAKVTRVEPSLQAAFVEYGGNRHGFLAFSEIHPDYYQLPQEDREALLREEAEMAAAEAEEDDEADDPSELDIDEIDVADEPEGEATDPDPDDDTDAEDDVDSDASEDEASDTKPTAAEPRKRRSRRVHPSRRYKIQEVVRRRQVMLIQVVKEERGNKGAALTTYLSLAGRYCVLMPNTPRGGGISRKIANSSDRKRLKTITKNLDVPQGMGLIVRTAGAKRTKTDIKRDFDYLQKLWDKIREKTLTSMAPTLVNEEGGLVHRAMRDLYDKDVDEVLIQGKGAYREAKDLARILMPSQAKKVKQWKDSSPLFVAKRIEEQLDSIFSPVVKLKSGGYLVINQTEALVAIDVNSGKSTRGKNIEQTATQTNLEAAEEACRQMRLRDLAGLVVIDFIDMDENKNNRSVEKRMKDNLALDRARVQNGRISQFGLMEISRQRRRTGVLESSSTACESCNGTGRQRSIESAALQLLRAIEARASGGGLLSLNVEAPGDVALYLLNNKRDAFTIIEEEAGLAISISSSESMLPGDFKLDAEKDPSAKNKRRAKPVVEGDADDEEFATAIAAQDGEDAEEERSTEERSRGRKRGRRGRKSSDEETESETEHEESESHSAGEDDSEDDDDASRKRRRRGRRGGRRRRRDFEDSETAKAAAEATAAALALPTIDSKPATGKDVAPEDGGAYLDGLTMVMDEILDEGLTDIAPLRNRDNGEEAEDGEGSKRKRRGRRGGRNRKNSEDGSGEDTSSDEVTTSKSEGSDEEHISEDGEKPKRRRRRGGRGRNKRKNEDGSEIDTTEETDAEAKKAKPANEPVSEQASAPSEPRVEAAPAEEAPAKPKPRSRAKKKEEAPEADPAPAAKPVETTPASEAEAKPKKRGWWARRKD